MSVTGEGGGLVFGIPLGQCVENERLARAKGDALLGEDAELRRKSHHGSRSSFSSLIESSAKGEVRLIHIYNTVPLRETRVCWDLVPLEIAICKL